MRMHPDAALLDIAGVDDGPEAAVAAVAAEGNHTGQAGAEKFEKVFAMRAECAVMSAILAVEVAVGVVGYASLHGLHESS
jgi:hypothetical protein